MPPKPRTKRERNIYGDFVVTKINIKERVIEVPKNENEEEEEEESEESEEEEQAPEQEPEEEEKKKGKSARQSPCQPCVFTPSFVPCRAGQNFEQKGAEASRRRRV
jgi:hypothetical protein